MEGDSNANLPGPGFSSLRWPSQIKLSLNSGVVRGNGMEHTIALKILLNQEGGERLAGLTEIFLFFRVSGKTPH
jgi:hypothetical protein